MLKKVLIWIFRIGAVIVLLAGIGKILDNPKTNLTIGIILIVAGIAGIIVTAKLHTKADRSEYKKKQKPNRCANCGSSMQGAQYRYNWETIEGDINFCCAMTIIAICPKCGLEKKLTFQCPPPNYFELKKPNYNDIAYAQRKIREHIEDLFKD